MPTKKRTTRKATTATKRGTLARAKGGKAASLKAKGSPQAAKKRPIKLTDRQSDILRRIQSATAPGYMPGKGESRTLEALAGKKLLKRGPKDKQSGNYHYMITKTGAKHLGPGAAGTPSGANAGGAGPGPGAGTTFPQF